MTYLKTNEVTICYTLVLVTLQTVFLILTMTWQISSLLPFPLPRWKFKAYRIYVTSLFHIVPGMCTNFTELENLCSFLYISDFQCFSAAIFHMGSPLPLFYTSFLQKKRKVVHIIQIDCLLHFLPKSCQSQQPWSS